MFNQTPPTVAYPNVQTDAWVVISRLTEAPVRVVPNLGLVNHASEFALPIPTGEVPAKAVELEVEVQVTDDQGLPVYDDGASGTTDDVDGDGNPYPPLLETITEEVIVSLRDNPEEFTLQEVFEAVMSDFLRAFPYYDYGYLIVFDDRYDGISLYYDQQETSGLASGSHPLFIGPIQGRFNVDTEPRGYLLLVAPEIEGVDWYLQIRHGVIPAGQTFQGPLLSIEQASRQRLPTDITQTATRVAISRLLPMYNTPVSEAMLTDTSDTEVNYFWIRTAENSIVQLQRPYPVIPFLILLGRSSGL